MEKFNNNFKKNSFNIAFITISTIILFSYFIISDNLKQLIFILKNSSKIFLLCALVCIIIYWIFDAISLYLVSHKLAPSFKFKKTLQTSMIGQLFNCITPFASGGQPIQAYSMVKYGIPLGTSSSILLAKFIVYQTVLTFYSLFTLIFKFRYFSEKVSGFSYIVFIGFAVNTIVVLFLIGIGFFPKITEKILLHIIELLSKFKILRNKNKKETIVQNISIEISNFYESFQFLKSNITLIIHTSIVVILQLTFFYLIPYFICLALNASNINIANIISAGAFVLMVSSFIPLPGASGGAEGSFYLFFAPFFTQTGSIGIAIFLWRILTFYFTILIGAIFSKPIK